MEKKDKNFENENFKMEISNFVLLIRKILIIYLEIFVKDSKIHLRMTFLSIAFQFTYFGKQSPNLKFGMIANGNTCTCCNHI